MILKITTYGTKKKGYYYKTFFNETTWIGRVSYKTKKDLLKGVIRSIKNRIKGKV